MTMKNCDESIEINCVPNWTYIPDYPYRILIIGGSGSGKANVLLNLIKLQQPEIDKKMLYVKDPLESNYQLLTNGREKIGVNTLKNPKELIDYSQTINDVYEYLEDYNSTRKRKVLIVFDDMESNKKLSYHYYIVLKRKKTQHFTCFYITIFFQRAKNYKIKCNPLFYHENT